MTIKQTILYLSILLAFSFCGNEKPPNSHGPVESEEEVKDPSIIVAASMPDKYLSLIKGKKIALVVNQTSMVDNTHLVDTLLNLGILVKKVFAPEHGFRGNAEAGKEIDNSVDSKTNLPLISLYGKNRKPTSEMISDIDVVLFDIQDVGVRFYTYISTMHYVMEACAENGKKMIILDRPNPNGDYVDGPILDMANQSFVGMHPIPIVHGLTVGELATMINGEKWLKNGLTCDLKVIKVGNYDHQKRYKLPVNPSPNLPNDISVRLYPSLCLFEGTVMSIGRGTYHPFQVIGYPDSTFGDFTFIPKSIEGMSKYPKHENKTCYGTNLQNESIEHTFTLKYLIDYYGKFSDKENFFIKYFTRLVGSDELQKQIELGKTESEIRGLWQTDLDAYKLMRKKYLLYPEN